MAETFGSAFLSQYGDEPNDAWVAGLSGFTDQQIISGYAAVVSANLEFCPNLSKFVSHCLGDWEHRRLKPCHEALSAPVVDLGEGRLLAAPGGLSPDQARAHVFGVFKS